MVNGREISNVVIRELIGEDEDILYNRSLERYDRVLSVVKNSVIELSSADNLFKISDPKEISKAIDAMVSLNLTFFLLKLRQISVEDNVTLKITCSECKATESKTVTLSSFEFPSYSYKDTSYIVKFPDGSETECHLTTVGDDYKMSKIPEADANYLSKIASLRIDKISNKPVERGVKKVKEVDKEVEVEIDTALSFVKSMSLKSRRKFRDEFIKKENIFKLEFDSKCNKCGKIDAHELPMDVLTSFFFNG
jgi:predicted nucleic-acid-binding Zn-ribbon protein